MVTEPKHTSKGEGYILTEDDWVQIKTSGGGGYGAVAERDVELVARDVRRSYLDTNDISPDQPPELATK